MSTLDAVRARRPRPQASSDPSEPGPVPPREVTMNRRRTSGLRPKLDKLESRCLLSSAAIDIENNSQEVVTFKFRWSPSSAWTTYTEAPGQSEVITRAYSSSL